MPKKKRINWRVVVDEATKQAILNYEKDWDIIDATLSSLEILKADVLPKHINLQTNAFSVILETVWNKLQSIKENLVYAHEFYIDSPHARLYDLNWWQDNRVDRETNMKQMCTELLALRPILQEWYDVHGTPDLIIVGRYGIKRTEKNRWDAWLHNMNRVQNDMSEKHAIVQETEEDMQKVERPRHIQVLLDRLFDM